MEAHAKKLKIETYRAPFGWTKALHIKIKGHPLAETAKIYTAEDSKTEVKPVLRKTKLPKVKEETLSENDHRIIGKQLDLYSFHEVGPGMVFWHNKGMTIRNALIDLWRKEQQRRDYQEINTPIVLDKTLWEISGHWDHFRENMFFTHLEDRDFALKPMNCPGAILVFKNTSRSYKDLPLRLAELGTVNRNELSGVLSGLFRLRTFTQDDAHIFVTQDQLIDEIDNVVDLIDYFYRTFGFEYHVELSTRPEKAMGSEEVWRDAESALKKALEKKKLKFKVNPGDGAFYGPKIDFHIKDSLGRTWQCATVQVDFMMPERFDLNYVGEDGKDHRPIIIHRVIYGSIERFIGILVEHYQGKFPVWLAPVQVGVLSISEDNVRYAKSVEKKLAENGIRVVADYESRTIQYKIRNSQLQKIPFAIVIGKKEEQNKTIAVRTNDGKVKYGVKLETFVKDVKKEIENLK
ncbi:MAG: threonine--tRNA ligase [Candidatus Aenigmarchaeota archaeon]|nr:threonine--tRNA ligase [Candidatus Aenigmarchaeota archaeon]